jgi:hypothetical protein
MADEVIRVKGESLFVKTERGIEQYYVDFNQMNLEISRWVSEYKDKHYPNGFDPR